MWTLGVLGTLAVHYLLIIRDVFVCIFEYLQTFVVYFSVKSIMACFLLGCTPCRVQWCSILKTDGWTRYTSSRTEIEPRTLNSRPTLVPRKSDCTQPDPLRWSRTTTDWGQAYTTQWLDFSIDNIILLILYFFPSVSHRQLNIWHPSLISLYWLNHFT